MGLFDIFRKEPEVKIDDRQLKNLDICQDFVEYLNASYDRQIYLLFKGVKSKEDLRVKVRDNIFKYFDKFIPLGLLLGTSTGMYHDYEERVTYNLARHFVLNDVDRDASRKIIDNYKEQIVKYVNNNNRLRNNINLTNDNYNDITIPFTIEAFDELATDLYRDKQKHSKATLAQIARILIRMEALYSKDILLNRKDLVDFEMEYGYFDIYSASLEMDREIPTIEERMDTYEKERVLTYEVKNILDNQELLLKRLEGVNTPNKEKYVDALKKLQVKDYSNAKEVIQACYKYYETANRKEIIDSLEEKRGTYEVRNLEPVKNKLVHFIINDTRDIRSRFRELKIEEIIQAREDGNTSRTLSFNEERELKKLMAYCDKYLLNEAKVGHFADVKTYYRDSARQRNFITNTSNQLSTCLITENNILNLPTVYGIGFNKDNLKRSMIRLTSKNFLNTSIGVEHLEIDNDFYFEICSASLKEIENKFSFDNEIVLYRQNEKNRLTPGYVFVSLDGLDEEYDKKILEEALELGRQNNLCLHVYRVGEMKKQYLAQNTQEPPKTLKKRY